jgi:hypothetical protein
MSGNGEEDKKPAEGGAHINLKVKGQVCAPAVSPPNLLPLGKDSLCFRPCGDRRDASGCLDLLG